MIKAKDAKMITNTIVNKLREQEFTRMTIELDREFNEKILEHASLGNKRIDCIKYPDSDSRFISREDIQAFVKKFFESNGYKVQILNNCYSISWSAT